MRIIQLLHLQAMLEYCYQNDADNLDLNVRNPGTLQTPERWMIYFNWANIVRQELKKKLLPLKVSFTHSV